MGLKDKFLSFVAPVDDDDEDEDDEEYEEEEETRETPVRTAKPVSTYEAKRTDVKGIPSNTKMVLFEPRSFEEAEEIAKHLKSRRAAVVNLHRLPRDYAQRTIDFLTGVVFALDGTIQKVGHNVILCAPRSIGVDGAISLDSDDD